ncbi:unnamed protein product [Fusarium graminearum]|uniref:Uncharacterized protein n=1 Tax=Gibberella zeae TaxID=5518 RepID=A0A4E9DPM5_GIBZA|nr:unnamed protein product [Fusarium graminearum]CAF3491401.1 unnamed protein product [Fusarium graminearum]CAG1977124.1 unnamed protein product [Fusarium graminearum]CAG2013192.1 unnamed protein product [Fusarium graminearum]
MECLIWSVCPGVALHLVPRYYGIHPVSTPTHSDVLAQVITEARGYKSAGYNGTGIHKQSIDRLCRDPPTSRRAERIGRLGFLTLDFYTARLRLFPSWIGRSVPESVSERQYQASTIRDRKSRLDHSSFVPTCQTSSGTVMYSPVCPDSAIHAAYTYTSIARPCYANHAQVIADLYISTINAISQAGVSSLMTMDVPVVILILVTRANSS